MPRGSSRNGSENPFDTYLRQINETPLLSTDEEKHLAYRIEDGDLEARQNMIRANLRLVVNVARGYTRKGLPLPDLVEEGNLGLIRAVEGYDPSFNTRFSTYAVYWIKHSIKRALVNTAREIRIPAYMVELLAKWRKATGKLQNALGRPPSHDEVGRELGLSKKKLDIVKKAIRIYNTALITEDPENGMTIDEMVQDPSNRTPDEVLIAADDMREALDQLDTLESREQAIIRMRFGLDNQEPKTLKGIAQKLGLTPERVRQVEATALSKLHRMMLNGNGHEKTQQKRGA